MSRHNRGVFVIKSAGKNEWNIGVGVFKKFQYVCINSYPYDSRAIAENDAIIYCATHNESFLGVKG